MEAGVLCGLVQRQKWRQVGPLVDDILSTSGDANLNSKTTSCLPHDALQLRFTQVLALVRMRQFVAANELLAQLGDLSGPQYRFETFKHIYSSTTTSTQEQEEAAGGGGAAGAGATFCGSFVPFGLKLIAAELPLLLSMPSSSNDGNVSSSSSSSNSSNSTSTSASSTTSASSSLAALDPLCVLRDECLQEAGVLEDLQSVLLQGQGQDQGGDGTSASAEGAGSSSLPKLRVVYHRPPTPAGALCVVPPPTDASLGIAGEDQQGNEDRKLLGMGAQADVLHVYGFTDVESAVAAWYARADECTFALATRLVSVKDYVLALDVLAPAVRRRSDDAVLLSGYARVLLQMGNIPATGSVMARVDEIVRASGAEPDDVPLVRLNRGLLYLGRHLYAEALEELRTSSELFSQAERTMRDVDYRERAVVASNHAVCRLFMCQLPKAINELEELVMGDPRHSLLSPIVSNLCTLYELRSDSTRSNERKKSIMALAARDAPDSFDFKVLKISA